jgi:alpha/beta superfamily hydrolase
VSTLLPVPIVTADGHTLEGELSVADRERCGMVLCHPHPQFGGTMRSIVISALFGALPGVGITCLRFNFRGVEGSEGSYDEGRGERLDAVAAVATLADRLAPATPLVLTGWSFGGDVALSTVEPRLAGWLAVAPPLHRLDDPPRVAADERPKLLALAEHDEVRPPAEVEALVAPWRSTEVVVVEGASHFFVGRTDRLAELAQRFVDQVASPRRDGSEAGRDP